MTVTNIMPFITPWMPYQHPDVWRFERLLPVPVQGEPRHTYRAVWKGTHCRTQWATYTPERDHKYGWCSPQADAECLFRWADIEDLASYAIDEPCEENP